MDRAPYAVREVGAVLGVLVAGLLLLAPRYGPHRDELYFVEAGRRLAWGYPDQPALTPLLARVADFVAPGELVVLRIWPALAVAGVVALAVQMARLLGAGRAGQVLTAVTVAFSALVVGLGHMLSTATLDLLCWTAVLVIVTQALVDDRPRWWLLAGAVAGVGLHNKHTVTLCLLGVFVGVALVRETRPVLRTPWPWLGGLLALVIWLPNLVWQARHGWPVRDLSADIAEEYGGLGGRLGLLGQALVMFSPLMAAVWIAGLVVLLRRPAWARARPVAIAFLTVLAVLLVTGGKGYYLGGLVPPLLAAGCTALAAAWSTRAVTLAGAALVASAAVAYPAMLPLLPAGTFGDSAYAEINDVQLDTVGWPEYAAQVRAVVDALPADQRRSAVVFTSNYGEAGALAWYDVGLPIHSGHNGYRFWGPPPDGAGPVVVVLQRSPTGLFADCTLRARLRNSDGVDNEEVGAGVWLCSGPVGSWRERWPDLVHYDA